VVLAKFTIMCVQHLLESGDFDDICVTRVLHFVGSVGLLDA
jgi:hypothetical protein